MAERDELEAAKRASFAQLLFQCARRLNERAIARARKTANAPNLRTAHTLLLPHIDLQGTRLTELARRLGVSKQAVGQLVDEMVQMGALRRVPDPADGRAKLIRFATKGGRLVLFDGLALLSALEAEITAQIGRDRVYALHDALVALAEVLAQPDRAATSNRRRRAAAAGRPRAGRRAG